jgi:alkenylglycerophosphocholine/alkenylglycerophosphoethanolamine hydrolase
MTQIFAAAALVSALLAIAADWNERRHASFYLLKPLTTLLIALIAAQAAPGDLRALMLCALALSLLGDICLMFKGNAWFIAGLSSFLLAHLAFIPALLHGVTTPTLPLWSAAFVLAGAAYFAWLLPKTGPLKIAVVVYGAVLIAMLLAAIARWTAMPNSASLWALAGAGLFVVSDSSLSLRQFNGPYRGAQALILSTYWSAIGCIAYASTLM